MDDAMDETSPISSGFDGEIQLISDGSGLAVIGDPTTVERFLTSAGLPSRELDVDRAVRSAAGKVGSVGEGTAEIAAGYGRWVKLTEESARLKSSIGLMKDSKTGLEMGVVQAGSGQGRGIKAILRFEKGVVPSLTNPALLTGVAGIMAQVAMQQTMDEILDYLGTIDEKVDDILRAQKDAALSEMIGVELLVEEAMTVREHVGRVSETTWSKVQASAASIATTQAYALSRLDALAETMERKSQMGELAKAAGAVQAGVQEWLAVLARCFQLHDAVAVLELDRVLDASPEELEQHRVGLLAARQARLDRISQTTLSLLDRMHAAATEANSKVLLHPIAGKSVVESRNHVAVAVVDFHGRLGIDRDREDLAARRWLEAVADARDRAVATGAQGVDAARRKSGETIARAGRATEVFRSVDIDGDGIPDKPRALTAAEDVGTAIKGATSGAVGAVGSLLRRTRGTGPEPGASAVEPAPEET